MNLKNTLFITILLFFANTQAQVDKNLVVLEIATGTWCSYCPAAAIGADEMISNGHQVAIIENHGSDAYDYPGSNLRNAFYTNTSFPSTTFNGLDKFIGGGDASSSNYADYLTRYNNAIAIPSDFTLDLSVQNSSMGYIASIEISEPGDFIGNNLAIHLVVVESHISESWEGLDELNFVSRAMYPDSHGTSFTGGNRSLNFVFNPELDWVKDNCDLIAFIQDNDTKEILQARKTSLVQVLSTNNEVFDSIKIFPNPSKNHLNIIGAKGHDIILYDIFGNKVLFNKNISFNETIHFDKLTSGLYIIKISKGSTFITRKVVIQ